MSPADPQVSLASGVGSTLQNIGACPAPSPPLRFFAGAWQLPQLAEEYTAATWYNHSPAGIVEFFDGLELAGPGVTEARTWPKRPPAADDCNGHVLAGVGRVPGM